MHKHSQLDEQSRTFIPAAGKNWLLPLYDPIVKLFGGDTLRRKLIQLADIQSGQDVLEIGCGTGSVLLMIREMAPGAHLNGLDPDPSALARAKRKATKKNADIKVVEGFSDNLPYADESFDRVLSSFMFHHLPENEKGKTLFEVYRVLKKGGTFHIVDFEQPESKSGFLNWIHSHEMLKDNSERRILSLLNATGFAGSQKQSTGKMMLMKVAYYTARRK